LVDQVNSNTSQMFTDRVLRRYVGSGIKGVGSRIRTVGSGIAAVGTGITEHGIRISSFLGIRDQAAPYL